MSSFLIELVSSRETLESPTKIFINACPTYFKLTILEFPLLINFSTLLYLAFPVKVKAVCATARKCSMVTGAWDWRPTAISPGLMIDGTGANVTIREVHMKALEECGRIAKTLMDATGHAHLIMRDADFRTRSLGVGAGWEEDDDNIPHTYSIRSESPDLESTPNTPLAEDRDGDCPSENSMSLTLEMAAITNSPPPTPMNNRNKRRSIQGVKFRRAVHQEAEDHLKQVSITSS